MRLRRVDGREVGLSASKVELAPASTCCSSIAAWPRAVGPPLTVEAELEAGGSYRLVADATARNCEAVELIGD